MDRKTEKLLRQVADLFEQCRGENKQELIARKSGMPQRTISRIENANNTTVKSMALLCDYYGTGVWEMLVPGMDLATLKNRRAAKLVHHFMTLDDASQQKALELIEAIE